MNKYRVWDKEEKRMITDEQDFIPLIITNKGILRLNAEHKENLHTLIPFGGRFIPMQYTGLKDKNDKEIYEGDIINIINNSVDEEDGCFIIKYDVETARYVLSGDNLVYDFDNTYANECEIMGNIYENHELLYN